MKVEVSTIDTLVRELRVEVSPKEFSEQMEKKFEEVRRKVTLKGFRPGHAPMDMVRNAYGDQVKTDVIDDVLKATYPEAIREKMLQVASYPSVTDLKLTDDGGLQYTARVEVFPEIGTVAIDKLEIQSVATEATDEDVEAAMADLRKRFSDVRVLARPAQTSDIVTVDLFKVYDPKLVLTSDKMENVDIDLADETTIKEFREQIIGMKAGEEKEIEVTYTQDYPDPKFAGATVRYRCAVKEVKERLLPEIDDSFAKMTQIADTLLGLRLKIREDIKAQRDEMVKRLQKRQVIAQICDKNQLAIPEALIEDYLKAAVEDIKKQKGVVDEAAVRAEYRPVAITTLRWDMLWPKIAEQEKIEVLPADTENWIEGFAKRYGITTQQAMEQLGQSGRGERLKESLLEEKVLETLVTKATVTPAKKD